MTTTSTTTATPSATPTAASINAAAAQALLSSLNAGSGVDTATLVSSLVQAQFAAKTAQLKTQSDTITSQISAVSSLKSTISDFADALANLVKGGTLQSQPVVSNAAVLSASAIPGGKTAGLTASITVSQLASQQTAVSRTAFATKDTVVGTGTLTLKLGSATYNPDGSMATFAQGATDAIDITIDDANSSLSGIAAAINAKNAGVTASVVTDADGTAYLSMKGATGATQAFTLDATSTTGDLSQVAVGIGAANSTITAQAKNAKLSVDGVAVERASNDISDLIAGIKLSLTGVSATAVSLTTTRPTTALTNAVNDLVDTYNGVVATVKADTDPITGVLRADPAAKALLQSMQALVSKTLLTNTTAGQPATLAAIGVRTNRDGTLQVDADQLAAALKDYPDQVEAMFAFSTSSSDGVNAAMASLKLNATSTLYGLGASTTRYNEAQTRIAAQQDDIATKSESMTNRLTQQYASMNAKLSAYKSTQAYLTQQVDLWTKSTG